MTDTPPGAEWNARAYTRLSNPMQTWGEAILERLALRGDETALDLGCGSGRLTDYLLRRLPQGRVIAVDRSANMLAAAREHLEPDYAGRVDYVQQSLDELDVHQVADLAFSNAAFHWIKDHPRLLQRVFAALRPGGWLVAQCGAGPNIARVRERAGRIMASEPYRAYFGDWTGPWEFAYPDVMRERLLAAGFVDVETSMFEAPVQLSSVEETRDYFENVILGTHLARIADADLRRAFLESMTAQSAADDPAFRQDYWRLNLRARRPSIT
jgi:trans-aconitate 2-methyltransferase